MNLNDEDCHNHFISENQNRIVWTLVHHYIFDGLQTGRVVDKKIENPVSGPKDSRGLSLFYAD